MIEKDKDKKDLGVSRINAGGKPQNTKKYKLTSFQ